MKYYQTLKYKITKDNQQFQNVNHSYIQTLLAKEFQIKAKTLIVVLANLYDAQKYYDALSNIVGAKRVLFYPADQILTSIMALGSAEFKNERIYTLRALLENQEPYIVVTTYQGVLQYQLSPQDYLNANFSLTVKHSYDLNKIVSLLLSNGYHKNFTVERPGEFSVRGSLIDIYTHHNALPYRLDFFGNELEEIKEFDPITQRSVSAVNQIVIAPLSEVFYTSAQLKNAEEKINSYFNQVNLSHKEQEKLTLDLERLKNRTKLDSLSLYIPFFNSQTTTILDFVKNYQMVVVDFYKTEINYQSGLSDLQTYALSLEGNNFISLPSFINLSYLQNQDYWRFDCQGGNPNALDLNIQTIPALSEGLNSLDLILQQYLSYTKVVLINDESKMAQLKDKLTYNNYQIYENEFVKGEICLFKGNLDESFVDPNFLTIYLSEKQIFNTKNSYAIRYRSVINQSIKVRDVSELNIGDYVVHYDFGIGHYMGLKTINNNGKDRDYLHIVYANDEYLYTPVDQIDLVMKYRSFEDIAPTLSRLGGKAWSKTKLSVKQKIREMSQRLLELYAKRLSAQGFKFKPFDEELKTFADTFEYQETKDQQQAINDTLSDMQSIKPMDRLIAGDVGFGKTEVALRAAYLAVLNGKQVAYLCPTTVLARQHFYTFKNRLEKYGISVALLSRFVTSTQLNDNLEKINKGLVDVVIGTHRLLSKDVNFKQLGLFIVDEEQRFGVSHKEKIKEMKVNVDTLTLSATPIPRTLQMAISGIKDLSTIDTPPLNRYPIQTYVVERYDALIKEALMREIARGGQVFYLYNKVADIEKVVVKLKALVPEARIVVAHGQMNKNQLENILSKFIDHEYDVLVATTIIETGVDIPNSNTLIIHDADHLGLSQLYQIRGRVGRSDKIAYAYMMYEPQKVMTEEAMKRLNVIEDFTDLGSGFKIALRDLSIRGSGDILGAEQSGFIDSVGMDLYMKLLDEVIHNKELVKEVSDEVYSNRHISPQYIDNDAVRIEIHKRIAGVDTTLKLQELKQELIDRFGQFDHLLVEYMTEKLYKKLCSKLGVENASISAYFLELILNEESTKTHNNKELFNYANQFKPQVSLNFYRGRIQIKIAIKKNQESWTQIGIRFIEGYLERIKTLQK